MTNENSKRLDPRCWKFRKFKAWHRAYFPIYHKCFALPCAASCCTGHLQQYLHHFGPHELQISVHRAQFHLCYAERHCPRYQLVLQRGLCRLLNLSMRQACANRPCQAISTGPPGAQIIRCRQWNASSALIMMLLFLLGLLERLLPDFSCIYQQPSYTMLKPNALIRGYLQWLKVSTSKHSTLDLMSEASHWLREREREKLHSPIQPALAYEDGSVFMSMQGDRVRYNQSHGQHEGTNATA